MRIRVAAYVTLLAILGWFGVPADARRQAPRLAFAGRTPSAVRYLKASNPREDDRLGIGSPLHGIGLGISADGNTLAVSAPYEDSGATGINGNQQDDSAFDSGAAYVFVRNGNTWRQQAYLKPSNTQSSDKFGFALALSGDGNTLAVTATLEDSSARGINSSSQADNSADSSGAVYVFVRNGSSWSQQAYIKASNADAGDQFGWSVAVSRDGNTLAVGAQSEGGGSAGVNGDAADNSAADAGAVYVFVRSGTTWAQQAYVKASNAQAADRFGFSVTLSGDGNTLAAGSYDEDGSAKGVNGASDEEAPNSGAAYVYVRRGTTWTHDAYVKASNTVRNIAFGSSLTLSADGTTLAVGAVDETNLTRGIDGDQRSTPDNAVSAGAIYVFGRTGGSWQQQAYVKSSNIGPTDLFGIRMALSADGSMLAAGAPGQNGGGRGFDARPEDFTAPESGAVYVFVRTAGKWSQQAYVKAPNSEEFDQFGSGVALSGNGAVLAASSGGDDGGSKGDPGDNSVRDSGAVFVF
jgi:hypothetical protein